MSGALLGLYRPGTTWLHRAPAWSKLLGLLAAGTAAVLVRGPGPAVLLVVAALGLVLWARVRLRTLLRSLRGLLVTVLLLGLWLAWQQDPARAVESCSELVACVLLATVLTVTTPVDVVMETVTWALRPFRRLGVDPETVALAFTLVIRAVPGTVELADETRDAAVARGLQHDPRARLTPLVLRVVARARATGDALHARGVGD
ncbi:energy-coupling factor transporter transmembrane component T [Auraticoccus monumenti]|uniref:Biotin transport system permease protein n=1 Tax=Auraticoccus monumenti TaxID=675864 RepID=A0A1G7APY4_9ACTN|nr:energy-coupling factor transporter transmembrane component T [Auraticoccus monumenti]SDE16557.1 biotin transport system permease protein [Auraticoccus monumenti]